MVQAFDYNTSMTYYGPKELADSFRTVRNNTITIAEEIPEDKYGFRAHLDSRSVAETLIHIAHVPEIALEIHGKRKLTSFEGFDFMSIFGPMLADEKAPHSKAEIVAMLRATGDQFAGWLAGISDDVLAQTMQMPPNSNNPPTKTRFEMLLSVKEHEMHHRGQLMVLERMLGMVPHLTRQMQARLAQMQQAQAAKP